jgi:hypothetical protein
MAQATDGITFQDVDVFYSTNGSSWTEVSGETNQVTTSGFERPQTETATFESGTSGPIVKVGSKGSGTVTVRALYRENASALYKIALDAWNNNTDLYYRWTPKGTSGGNYRFTTGAGRVLAQPLPTGEAASGDVLVIEIGVSVGAVTQDTV